VGGDSGPRVVQQPGAPPKAHGERIQLSQQRNATNVALLDGRKPGPGGGIGAARVDSAAKAPRPGSVCVIPIDPGTDDLAETVRRAEPDGIDAVFDGVGGDYVETALSLLQLGGVLVDYANPGSKRGLLQLLARKAALRLTGGGRRLRLYGTNTWRYDRRPLLRDWRALFTLLAEGRISPIVARTFPLSEAAAANALMESGTVIGNLVLLPERLRGPSS